jgi:hypothetical protein
MLNRREAYTEAGRKTAEARNQRDESRAQHWARHFRSMRALEQGTDRLEAGRLYDTAYTEARTLPPGSRLA